MAAERRSISNSRPWPDTLSLRLGVRVGLVLALSVLSSSCLFKKAPMAFTPPPPRAQPTVRFDPVRLTAPPPLIVGNPASNVPQAPNAIAELPPPPVPKPAPRHPAVATAAPKPSTPAAAPETPAPRLGQVFTPDQQREYNRTIDESLERVKRALAIVSAKSLNAEQNEIANKIRTFQKQAEDAREQDLLTAVTLAKRADLLAQDLLERLP